LRWKPYDHPKSCGRSAWLDAAMHACASDANTTNNRTQTMRASEAHDNNMDRHKLATRIRKKIHDVRRRRLPRAAQGNQQERQPQQELILRPPGHGSQQGVSWPAPNRLLPRRRSWW